MWCSGTKKSNEIDVIREHVQHMLKLSKIKSRTNTNPPKSMPHLKKKLKPHSLKFEKNQLIQSENQLLLQKMFEIDSRTPSNKKLAESTSLKSLNRNNRIQSLSKITEENQELLTRLQKTKSSYNFKQWDQDHRFKQYLSFKLSENSRRIPRVSALGLTPSLSMSGFTFTRPTTSSNEKLQRPSTAARNKAESKSSLFI